MVKFRMSFLVTRTDDHPLYSFYPFSRVDHHANFPKNYTEKGYAHIKTPEGAIGPLQKFFGGHKDRATEEQW